MGLDRISVSHSTFETLDASHNAHFEECVDTTHKPLLMQGFFLGVSPSDLGRPDRTLPPPGEVNDEHPLHAAEF